MGRPHPASFAKRQREQEQKRRAEDKRRRRTERREDGTPDDGSLPPEDMPVCRPILDDTSSQG